MILGADPLASKARADAGQITSTLTSGQGSQTTDASDALLFTSNIATGQASQTTDITAALTFAATGTTGQGGQTTDAVASGGSVTPVAATTATRRNGGPLVMSRRDYDSLKSGPQPEITDLEILLLLADW